MSEIYRSSEGAREVARLYTQVLESLPPTSQQRRLDTSHGSTFVVCSGPVDAPPVLLLHGSLANSATWMREAIAWSKRLRLHAIDMIGEPGNSAQARPPLDSDAYADWLEQVMQGLSLERAHIVGISLGGWLALDFAVRRPERVSALALIAPGGIGRQRNILPWVLPLQLLGSFGKRKIRQRILGSLPDPPATGPGRTFAEMMRAISQHTRPRLETLPLLSDAALGSIAVPLLVVLGGRDVLLDSNQTYARVRALLPHARVDYRPTARHHPGDFSTEVLQFLEHGLAGVDGAP